jgi:hypothetical protein
MGSAVTMLTTQAAAAAMSGGSSAVIKGAMAVKNAASRAGQAGKKAAGN